MENSEVLKTLRSGKFTIVWFNHDSVAIIPIKEKDFGKARYYCEENEGKCLNLGMEHSKGYSYDLVDLLIEALGGEVTTC